MWWVALGGAIGASLRYSLSTLWSTPIPQFPWATWWINLLGCSLAGAFFALSLKYPTLQQEMRLFLMVGILGGFTTFSSFGLECVQLMRAQAYQTAILYAFSSLILGILLTFAAFILMKTCLKI